MLELKKIYKSFPGVNALADVSFCIRAGAVHVLCGENGAGKSTIMKLLNGVYQPDGGTILLYGKEVVINSPLEAKKNGIAMIFQELNYIPEISVAEFLFLGNWPMTKLCRIDWKKIHHSTQELLQKENLPYGPSVKLKDLSISDIQMLEIVKAVHSDARIIIMDEPSSAITQNEVERLFQRIVLLKSEGKSIIYASHKMEEIFQIADDITVLRDGRIVKTGSKNEFDINSIITLMVGRELANEYPKNSAKSSASPLEERSTKLLEVKNLSQKGVFENICFHVNSGEIVGLAGLIGAGRTEIVRAVSGLDSYSEGTILVQSQVVKIKNVRDGIRNGIVMLPEDRRRYGIVANRSVKENIVLSSLRKYIHHGFLHVKDEKKDVKDMCKKMKVKTPSLDVSVDTLSGGNQQKVVLSKWSLNNPDVFIMDEPTRGIDVGAKYEIYRLMQDFVDGGKGILMVSSEMPELLGMCDRIYIICEGKIAGELSREDFDAKRIMKLATGIKEQHKKDTKTS